MAIAAKKAVKKPAKKVVRKKAAKYTASRSTIPKRPKGYAAVPGGRVLVPEGGGY